MLDDPPKIAGRYTYEASEVNKAAGYPETNSVLGNDATVTVTVKNLTVTPSAN